MKKDLKDIRVLCLELRARYCCTPREMCKILSLGINVWDLYEAGKPANNSNYNLISLMQDPVNFRELVVDCCELDGYDKKKILQEVDKYILNMNREVNAFRRNYYTINDSPAQ